ncbi:MAG TPA: NAD(P)H-dependent oxidoreductase [Saprospiraceae bacterium]|nr:NAD(P)H-dependent oxidoreductase [Saprospiraceae bacterium]HMP25896.1 NAD(P)H-dependent oxidoreductase [Saprospiraceae bacterium]
MITIISGTNRKNSECLRFARKYAEILQAKTDEPVQVLALEDIPHDWFYNGMYEDDGQSSSLAQLQDAYMLPAQKFVYVMPEYNGSFPGVVKLFIDACSVRQYKATFKNKKAALVGVATGRAGNLRGLEHFTGVLNHVGTVVLPNRLPISRIEHLVDADGDISDPGTLRSIEKQAEELLHF